MVGIAGHGLHKDRTWSETYAAGRDGQMALRWCAAGMIEAGKQFRRVNGHLHLPILRAAMERETAQSVGLVVHNDQVSAA